MGESFFFGGGFWVFRGGVFRLRDSGFWGKVRHTESLTGSKFKIDFGKSKFENQIVDVHLDRPSFISKI